MITLRRAAERGHADYGWLDTHYSFSFADYHDPGHMGFSVLRVINEDRIAPAGSFAPHPHRDMEIVTYVLSGALAHQDSMGNGSVIRPGEVQRMSAGTGVVHSETNPSSTEPLHLFQIWILPATRGIAPGYEQQPVPAADPATGLALVASPAGRGGAVEIHQDASMYVAKLAAGGRARLPLASGRKAWVQVAHGTVTVNGQTLVAGDGARLEGESAVELHAPDGTEALVFELP
jgi:quercetin 2,3-dioxygenase